LIGCPTQEADPQEVGGGGGKSDDYATCDVDDGIGAELEPTDCLARVALANSPSLDEEYSAILGESSGEPIYGFDYESDSGIVGIEMVVRFPEGHGSDMYRFRLAVDMLAPSDAAPDDVAFADVVCGDSEYACQESFSQGLLFELFVRREGCVWKVAW